MRAPRENIQSQKRRPFEAQGKQDAGATNGRFALDLHMCDYGGWSASELFV
jgi:hypothetical protein